MRRSDSAFKELVEMKAKKQIPRFKVSDIDDYFILGNTLGQGRFAEVISATRKTDNIKYALKVINKPSRKGTAGHDHTIKVKLAEREIGILRLISHPHIIFLDSVYDTDSKIFLVFEFCPMELGKAFRQKEIFNEEEARQVLQRLASAVSYLHRREIVHRDLKLENIMLGINPQDPEDKLYIKLIDFGLSAVKGSEEHNALLQEFCGTMVYMAPEIISEKMYSQQCDVWAMGVILYLLLSGSMPFSSNNETVLRNMILNKEPSFSDKVWKECISPGAIHLTAKLLTKNPAYRIAASEVESHPWIQQKEMDETQCTNVLERMKEWKDDIIKQETSDWTSLEASKSVHQGEFNKLRPDASTNEKPRDDIVTLACDSFDLSLMYANKKKPASKDVIPKPTEVAVGSKKLKNSELRSKVKAIDRGKPEITRKPKGRGNRRSSLDSNSSSDSESTVTHQSQRESLGANAVINGMNNCEDKTIEPIIEEASILMCIDISLLASEEENRKSKSKKGDPNLPKTSEEQNIKRKSKKGGPNLPKTKHKSANKKL